MSSDPELMIEVSKVQIVKIWECALAAKNPEVAVSHDKSEVQILRDAMAASDIELDTIIRIVSGIPGIYL